MAPSLFSIPQPCSANWAAMAPTADGRHCAACQTEVVDFTRLSEAEILAYLAYLAQRGRRPVCANAHAAQLAAPASGRWRRWLLAGLALLGWPAPAPAGPPVRPPLAAVGGKPEKPGAAVIVRGTVLDDRNGQPVAGARVLIHNTAFGTVTDEEGRFELVMAANWAPLSSGKLALHIEGNPFDFLPQDLTVSVRRSIKPTVLQVRLRSIPDRGQVMGKIRLPEPPVKPPRR